MQTASVGPAPANALVSVALEGKAGHPLQPGLSSSWDSKHHLGRSKGQKKLKNMPRACSTASSQAESKVRAGEGAGGGRLVGTFCSSIGELTLAWLLISQTGRLGCCRFPALQPTLRDSQKGTYSCETRGRLRTKSLCSPSAGGRSGIVPYVPSSLISVLQLLPGGATSRAEMVAWESRLAQRRVSQRRLCLGVARLKAD